MEQGRNMSYMRLIDTAREAFTQQPSGRNVLILHPQFRYHTALIDGILDSINGNALYVTLPPKGTLSTLWAELTLELAQIQNLTLPPLNDAAPAAAADTFCQAIAPRQPLTLVLTAYDHADAAIHEFVGYVAAQLGKNSYLLLDSRVWPHQLVSRLTPDQVAILPVSPDDMLLDYLGRDRDRVLLEVRALGSGQVLINGRQIDQWDGALPRSLFFYFIDRGMTTRDEVFATFWPELSTREATNVFHVTKRKISEILDVDLTVYSSGFYRISPSIDLHYDVVSFAEAVQNSAVAEDESAELLLQRAIDLHEREFLSQFEQSWAVRRRDELRSTYVDAIIALANLYDERGMSTNALGLYNRACGAYPQREDLARAQMRLCHKIGQSQRAMDAYDRLVAELKESLDVPPSPETRLLAEEIRQQSGG
jgi:DNA-binding SARP family transcriptional activator